MQPESPFPFSYEQEITTEGITGPSHASTAATASKSKRKAARSNAEKLNYIFDALREVGWTVPRFLEQFFKLEEDRSIRHKKTLDSMLNGSSKPYMASILNLIYQNAGAVSFLASDRSVEPGENMFATKTAVEDIRHATPAMTSWAVHLVGDVVDREGEHMVKREQGLHLRAQAKAGSRGESDRVSWDAVRNFSMLSLEKVSKDNAPATSHILHKYMGAASPNMPTQSTSVIQATKNVYRPENIIFVNAIMSLTVKRSNRANLYPMCRGIWLFAVQASKTVFRVESRIGQAVAYSTVYLALASMAEQRQHDLKNAVNAGKKFIVVSDNIQAYARQRDHRIGRENRMITGLAATAIEMEDYNPNAFNLEDIIERQCHQDRKTLTTETILGDLDMPHLEQVAIVQFLQVLISFVPSLASYQKDLERYSDILKKKPIPKNRHSKITPLATNSANEMHVQGMKQGILDFASVQMGLTDDDVRTQAHIYSGDGKTFSMFGLVKKLLAVEDSDLESLRWLIPLLELWHTKWMDLSRVVRTHWGSTDDPSSLSSIAQEAECPTPSDLRKVNFYDGSHLVNLALDAHLLNCWEIYYKADNLVEYLKENAPDFNTLVQVARKLVNQHATTQAHHRARNPAPIHPDKPPVGLTWMPQHRATHTTTDSLMAHPDDTETESNNGQDSKEEDLPLPPAATDGDITLANSTLFIRNGIWWREVCKAVAEGDPGRVWEVLKVWVFTFAGSGNPLYSQFLLETYCNLKWEFGPELKDAILMNWVVNPKGIPGHCIEMDLLQEHFNFWLEEMAQHKGKEFDEPFYRGVISSNVVDFLALKDEMEEVVGLRRRSKTHSKPHLDNELRAIMAKLHTEQVSCYRPGRNEGTEAADDFTVGMGILRKQKIKDFIAKSTVYSNVLKMRRDETIPTELPNVADLDEEEAQLNKANELISDDPHLPHPRMSLVHGDIYIDEARSVDLFSATNLMDLPLMFG